VSDHICSKCGSENTKAVSFNGRESAYECLDCRDRTGHSPPNIYGDYAIPAYGGEAWP